MTPILYSFRRCPYAIRARMAIYYCDILIELREVSLKNKPASMLQYSPKGTVPVLVTSKHLVLEESMDIILWALEQSDTENWLVGYNHDGRKLIIENDTDFKFALDHYKYSDRFPEHPTDYYRKQAEQFIQKLDHRLQHQSFLISDQCSVVDIAIFPFIRQFVFVDQQWFENSNYFALKKWLNYFLESSLFQHVMVKYQPWQENDNPVFKNEMKQLPVKSNK